MAAMDSGAPDLPVRDRSAQEAQGAINEGIEFATKALAAAEAGSAYVYTMHGSELEHDQIASLFDMVADAAREARACLREIEALAATLKQAEAA